MDEQTLRESGTGTVVCGAVAAAARIFVVLICVGLTKVIASALGAGELPVLVGLVLLFLAHDVWRRQFLIYTNTIQAVLMLIVAFVMLGSGLAYFEGGFGVLGKIIRDRPLLTQPVNPKKRPFPRLVRGGVLQFRSGRGYCLPAPHRDPFP
ncbi:MAG: hypothetical protein IPM98_11610 [Lewinellaceae bacterium]|nr:hypothetical protein [Lewinellaceae bacterium]